MKSCPTCNRTYPDETLAFCLVDGSILSAPYDPQATLPPTRVTTPPPTEILQPPVSARNETIQPTITAPPPPVYNPQAGNRPPVSTTRQTAKGSSDLKTAVLGAIIGAAVGATIGLILEGTAYSRSRYGEAAFACGFIGMVIGAPAFLMLKLLFSYISETRR